MRLRDWHILRLIRRAHARHVRTDPGCEQYTAPKPGSRLDQASRGLSCWQCVPPPKPPELSLRPVIYPAAPDA